MCTNAENTAYDRFLIEDDRVPEETVGKNLVSYKKNLLEKLKKKREGVFDGFTENDMKSIVKFREIIKLAYDNGIGISQLTKL